MKFTKNLLVLAITLLSTNAFSQTTGMVRSRLIEKVEASCTTKQRAERPASVSDAAIKSFCECNATYVADKMTNDDAMAMRGTDKTIDPAIIAAANKSCESKIN